MQNFLIVKFKLTGIESTSFCNVSTFGLPLGLRLGLGLGLGLRLGVRLWIRVRVGVYEGL